MKQSLTKLFASKPFLILSGLVVTVAIAGSTFYFNRVKDDTDTNTPEVDVSEVPQDFTPDTNLPTPGDEQIIGDNNGQPARSTPNLPQGGQLNVTRIEPNDSEVIIAAIVQGMNSGDCTVVYSLNGKRVGASSPIQQGPSYYACQINIPRSQFTEKGTWQISMVAQDGKIQASTEGRMDLL